ESQIFFIAISNFSNVDVYNPVLEIELPPFVKSAVALQVTSPEPSYHSQLVPDHPAVDTLEPIKAGFLLSTRVTLVRASNRALIPVPMSTQDSAKVRTGSISSKVFYNLGQDNLSI